MTTYMAQLEELGTLEGNIVKKTKVYKVLKGILKLPWIPREEEFKFKPRSRAMLTQWDMLSGEDAADEGAAPATNGDKPEEKGDSTAEEKKEETAPAVIEEAKPKDADGDVAMAEAAPESKDDAPAAEVNGDAVVEKAEAAVDAVA